jgi:hypothetical protein
MPSVSKIKNKKKMIDHHSVGEELLLSIPEIEQQCMIVEKAVNEGYFKLPEALENFQVNEVDYVGYLISNLNSFEIKNKKVMFHKSLNILLDVFSESSTLKSEVRQIRNSLKPILQDRKKVV